MTVSNTNEPNRSARLLARSATPVIATLLACSIAIQAHGQQAAASAVASTEGPELQLQEVVVTAQKRSERAQDVPISLTAISQQDLDQQGLRSIDDVTAVTPGVTFQRMGSGLNANYNDEQSDISIRGIESQAGTSTTAIYIDDAPVETRHIAFGSVNPFPALFDVDRVEVLRGPQGTLFGASAEGGAIRFISPEPGLNRYTGYVRSELSHIQDGDTSYNVGAAGGGPLINGVLGFRASVSFDREGGWVDRASYSHPGTDPLTPPTFTSVTQPDSNWEQTETVRLALKWVPVDGLSVTPSFYYQRLHLNDTAVYWPFLSDPANNVFRNGNALTNPSTDWFSLTGLKVDYDLGWSDLTSSTSYFVRRQNSISDYSQYERVLWLGNSYPQPGDMTPTPFKDSQNNFFEELRLSSKGGEDSRLKWTGGLFYGRMSENVQEYIYDKTLNSEFQALNGFPLCGVILGPCPDGVYLQAPLDQTIDKQVAAFGELTVKVFSNLSATLGLRVSHNEVISNNEATGGALVGNPGVFTSYSTSENPVTPKAVLSWQPNRDSMYYASVAKGYRVGGINGPNNQGICSGDVNALGLGLPTIDGVAQWPLKYSSDSLWSYELGAKKTFLDHRLSVDASVFLIRWKNIQQNVFLPDCGLQFITNLGQVMSRGGDIEVHYLPIESLALNFTASYTDPKFLEASCVGASTFDGTSCVSPGGLMAKPVASEGDRLLANPWNLHFGGEYSHALPIPDTTGYFRVDYQVLTAQRAQLAGQDPRNAFFDNTIPGLPLSKELGMRLGVRFSGFDLSIFGQNLTNEHPLMFESRDIPPVLPTTPPDNLYYARTVRPRTLGVTGTYRF
jgi:iron complex outermembrane recepter protein